MRKFLTVCLILVASFAFADQAVLSDANFGFLNVATPTFTLSSVTPVQFWFGSGAPPASSAYEASNSVTLHTLPAGTKGFEITVFGDNAVVGHRDDIATGTIHVGHEIADGSFMKWEGRMPLGGYAPGFCILINGTTPATATIQCWGDR